MTHPEKIEAIRQKCIEANPEIKELKFGCLVKEKLCGDMYEVLCPVRGAKNSLYMVFNPKSKSTHDSPLMNHEILGRPIRLADVLLAIKEKDKSQQVGVVKYPFFYNVMMAITKKELDGGEFWNLRKDSLEDQSEECINFLYEILI